MTVDQFIDACAKARSDFRESATYTWDEYTFDLISVVDTFFDTVTS